MEIRRWIGGGLVLAWVALAGCSLDEQHMRVPVTTSSDEARRLYSKGMDALDALATDEARDYFLKAAKKDPGFALAHLALADTAPTEKSFRESLKLAVLLSEEVSQGERLMIEAVQAAASGDLSAEREHYTALALRYPDDERAQILLGDSYFKRGNFSAALGCYETALELEPGFAVAYRRLGECYRLLGRYDEAEDVLSRYLELESAGPTAHALHARLLLKTGRFDESIASYERLLALEPGNQEAQVGIGNCLLFMGQSAQAQQAFQALHDQATDNAQRRAALVWVASTHLHAGAREEALSELDRALALAESDPQAKSELLGLIGDVLLETGSADRALDRFDDAWRTIEQAQLPQEAKQAARADHLYREAQVAAVRRELKTARAKMLEFRRSLTRGALAEENRFNKLRGLVALAQGNPRAAVQSLERSDRTDPAVILLLAQAYGGLGRTSEAVAGCRQLLDFNEPRFELAYIRPKAQQLMEELTAR